MNAPLPAPGSIWLHRNHGRAVRVVLVDETVDEVVAHNVEIAMRTGDPLASWAGTLEAFGEAFVPHPEPESYSKTAVVGS